MAKRRKLVPKGKSHTLAQMAKKLGMGIIKLAFKKVDVHTLLKSAVR